MYLGDEVVQATMCFFYPDIFGLKGKHLYKVQLTYTNHQLLQIYFHVREMIDMYIIF